MSKKLKFYAFSSFVLCVSQMCLAGDWVCGTLTKNPLYNSVDLSGVSFQIDGETSDHYPREITEMNDKVASFLDGHKIPGAKVCFKGAMERSFYKGVLGMDPARIVPPGGSDSTWMVYDAKDL